VHTRLEQVRAQPTVSVAVEYKTTKKTTSKPKITPQNRAPTPAREENGKKDKI
jgi:hypothetical protein